MKRRGFLAGMLALGAAPAIVRADALMKVVPRRKPFEGWTFVELPPVMMVNAKALDVMYGKSGQVLQVQDDGDLAWVDPPKPQETEVTPYHYARGDTLHFQSVDDCGIYAGTSQNEAMREFQRVAQRLCPEVDAAGNVDPMIGVRRLHDSLFYDDAFAKNHRIPLEAQLKAIRQRSDELIGADMAAGRRGSYHWNSGFESYTPPSDGQIGQIVSLEVVKDRYVDPKTGRKGRTLG